MAKNKTVYEVDTALADYGNKLINGGKVKKVSSPSVDGMIDEALSPKANRVRATAKSIRTAVKRITKRTPEVMVKVTGGGKSMGTVKAHMNYISRNGQLEAVDQDGNKVKGKDDLQETAEEWQMSGSPISEDESNYKQAFNIVLSMPKGTNEVGVYEAAKAFAEEHFKDHKYLMVQHTYTNDPSKDPSENPHVHIVVKAVSDQGKRLNPRKADLQNWRESFAEKLRERGVEANATKRVQRLQKNRAEKQAVHQMKKKGKPFKNYGKNKASQQRIEKSKQQEKEALNNHKEIAKALAQSPEKDDRKLAVDLVGYLNNQLNQNSKQISQEEKQVKSNIETLRIDNSKQFSDKNKGQDR